jgi:cytochrome c oxidase cbb3-type subunit 3
MSSRCRADLRTTVPPEEAPKPQAGALSRTTGRGARWFETGLRLAQSLLTTNSGKKAGILALFPLTLLAACGRETRDVQGRMMQSGDRADKFAGNAWRISNGARLYVWMNCAGCHSHGGGGMGPPLRDAKWRYGSSMSDMVFTILNGRPNGMPPFRGKITEEQAWELAAYVRSLSARTREDALSGRADEPANVEPPPLDERKHPRAVTPDQDVAQKKAGTQ